MRRLFVPVAPGAVQVCSRRCRSAEFQHVAKSSAFSITDVHPLAALSPRSAVTIPIQASPPLASPPPPRRVPDVCPILPPSPTLTLMLTPAHTNPNTSTSTSFLVFLPVNRPEEELLATPFESYDLFRGQVLGAFGGGSTLQKVSQDSYLVLSPQCR